MNEELDALKRKADTLGVAYSANIGVETLRARINEKQAALTPAPEIARGESVNAADPVLTRAQRHRQMRKDATKLVRCRITCMNPAKQDVPGEIIAVSNSAIGVIKHFVPFGEVTDEGWHIPQIIFDELSRRKCTIMRPKRDGKGFQSHEPVQIREFSIDVLPALSEAELKALAQRQAMAKGTAAALAE